MTFALICTVVFLLGSGCDAPRDAAKAVLPGHAAEPVGEMSTPVQVEAAEDHAAAMAEVAVRAQVREEAHGGAGMGGVGVSNIGPVVVVVERDGDGIPDRIDEPEAKLVVQARAAVRQTSRKTIVLNAEVDGLALDIKQRRWERLNGWALRKGWTQEAPPPAATWDVRIMGWWSEWRELKVELELGRLEVLK
jgi:hypothetical protein